MGVASVATFIDKFLGFLFKPIDASAGGIPLTQNDQVFLEVHAAVLPATIPTLTVTGVTFNPSTGLSRTVPLVRFLVAANDYTLETAPAAPVGTFSDGELLTSVTVASSATVPAVGRCHVSVYLFRKNVFVAQLIGDYITNENIPTWIAGNPVHFKNAFYGNDVDGKLYTFQGTVVNGAGGAGTQSLTIAPPGGGRFEVLSSRVLNGDTVGRTLQVEIDDAVGGNIIAVYESVIANAATSHEQPLGTVTSAATSTFNGGIQPITVAGANVYVMSVAAVAASQDSAYACVLRVWGGAPTFTLAGASTPVLTTNTSRFEGG